MARIAPTWHLAWTWGCSKGSVLISSFTSLSNLWGKYYCSSLVQIWAPRSRTGKKFVQGHFAREGQSYAVFPYYTSLQEAGARNAVHTGSLWLTRGFSTIPGSRFGPENLSIKKTTGPKLSRKKGDTDKAKATQAANNIFSPGLFSSDLVSSAKIFLLPQSSFKHHINWARDGLERPRPHFILGIQTLALPWARGFPRPWPFHLNWAVNCCYLVAPWQ